MSCNAKGKKCINAAKRNGIWGLANGYLGTLGSWATWRDTNDVDDITSRLGQVTAAYFGISMRGGVPKLASRALVAMLAAHVAEQFTGSAATLGWRMFGRGQPVAKYRGVIVRRNPNIDTRSRFLNRLTRGRVVDMKGYYFFEGSRTWLAESVTYNVRGSARTVSHVKSMSFPWREHFFDRPFQVNGQVETAGGDDAEQRSVPIQRVIDVVKGDDEPTTIPGYLGSTNELDNATLLLGSVKRGLYKTHWLLVDESERDMPAGYDFVDYDALLQGVQPGRGTKDYYEATPSGEPKPSPAKPVPQSYADMVRSEPVTPVTPSTSQPTTARQIPGSGGLGRTASYPSRSALSSIPRASRSRATDPSHLTDPVNQVKDRWREGDREYPLAVKRLTKNPISGLVQADAVYYDPELRRWREITDPADRQKIAQAVQTGQIKIFGIE